MAAVPPHPTQTTNNHHLFNESILSQDKDSDLMHDNDTMILKRTNKDEAAGAKADDDWSTQGIAMDVMSLSSVVLALNQTSPSSPRGRQRRRVRW
jgi:hypothetical protein